MFLFISLIVCVSSNGSEFEIRSRRTMLGIEKIDEDNSSFIKKKITNLSNKNYTKLIKSNLSTKNQTKLLTKTPNLSTKNQTKIAKSANSTKTLTFLSKPDKKLNSTSLLKLKKLNSTSKSYNSTSSSKKTSDLIKLSSKTKTQIIKEKNLNESQSKSKSQIKKQSQIQIQKVPNWIDQDSEDDLVSEFRDLPSRFQKTILPDFERISMASKKYLTKANKEMTKGFKPIVGHKYASTIATVVSFAFILIPLLLVSLVVNRIKAYFSIQKVVIFIQVYLSIYFSILCFSSIVTGLEPLRFFYATSQFTYVCLMVMQTLGYVLYLLLLVMYLILVFSTESGLGSRLLGLAQIFVGLAVGLHFYVAVFHRVVLHQPPKTNWKVHGVYATCFLAICLLAKFDRRKKAYLEDGGEEGKKN